MAEIVFAAAAPHAPGLVGLLDAAPDGVRDVVQEMYADLRQSLLAARPDVLIVFANDHLANSRIRAYPDFLIGMAPEHSGPYEWFKEWINCRDYTVRGDTQVAEALFRGLNRRGHRMFAERDNLRFDDNISVPAVMLDLDDQPLPRSSGRIPHTAPPRRSSKRPDTPTCRTVSTGGSAFCLPEQPWRAPNRAPFRQPHAESRRSSARRNSPTRRRYCPPREAATLPCRSPTAGTWT